MNSTLIFVALSALALAACSQTEETAGGNDAAPSAGASAMSSADTQLRPGQWETTSEVLEMAMPGMPDAMMKDAIGRKTNFTTCVTPEQAARDPGEMMLEEKPGGATCTRERFTMRGGTLDAAMTCTGGEMPGTMRMEVAGQYGAEAYENTVTMTSESPPGAPNGGTVRIVSKTTAKRIGDCTEGAKAG